jgi:hypothetical protein
VRRALDGTGARWAALALYVVALYTILPWGPRIGLGVARTASGTWALGPGLAVAGGAAAVALARRLARRRAPLAAWLAVAAVAVVAAVTTARLRSARLERTHLPEYGVAAALAWRALVPLVPGRLARYVAAAVLGAAIGWGDEFLQAVTPGRYYDLRDVGLNALGAVLGVIVLAAAHAGDAASGPERGKDVAQARVRPSPSA